MKHTHKTKPLLIWFIVLCSLLIFVFVITLVLTQNAFLYNTINSALDGERRQLVSGDPSEYQYYTTDDYADKKAVLTAANALNEKICEEGIILLKNEDKALPLTAGQRISVFGKNSDNLVLGGSGSSSGTSSKATIDIYDSLENAGFAYNPSLKTFYESNKSGEGRPSSPGMGSKLTGFPVGETPWGSYDDAVKGSYAADYNDAAIVVLSRIGGEGYDLPRTMFWNGSNYTTWTGDRVIPGAKSKDSHYLQLDQNETDMLDNVCASFEKVVVVINSSATMELGFLEDPAYENIKAALWIGNPGGSGIEALGKVLNGTVNPSGRTVDTYAKDFKNDPTWHNFGNNLTNNGNRYMLDGKTKNAYFVEYREGIYIGYRYYETKAFTEGGSWHEDNVVYPFGYGKSYTTFEWTAEAVTDTSVPLGADSVIDVNVTVKNTGDRPGKDVVQLYYTAPYEDGKIEKAHVVLGDYIKTDMLEVGEAKTYPLSISVRDMASYDYDDANGNGFNTYELDKGTYTVKIMRNASAQALVEAFDYTLAQPVRYDEDTATGAKITNLFDDVSDHIDTYLSRKDNFANWDVLKGASEAAYREVSQDFISSLTYKIDDKESDPWYVAAGDEPKQSKRIIGYNDTETKLYHLVGVGHGEEEKWDKLLDQLTVGQMADLIAVGNYRTLQIPNIDKPLTVDADGPMGFAIFMGESTIYDTCYYASECVIGATWNDELAEAMGRMIGNEGIIGNEAGDGRTYSGWYAPAMNLHRSQFGGRNFEYYSEDGLLSGRMAQSVVIGAKSKGVYTYCKHFALNEQETNRDTTGLITWAHEQSMRELYFKPFEMAVKNGKTTAMMSSFNRMGTVWAGGDYRLLTQLLRDEWGFEGMVITDFNLSDYMNVDQMIRAGGDLNLSPSKSLSDTTSATAKTAMRKAVKNILYTVANSNAMNGSGPNVIWRYAPPIWVIWLIATNCVVLAACLTLGVFLILRIRKSKKQITEI